MQILKFEDREEWLAARRGKITGSRLNDVIAKRGGEYKLGYYELIAERLAIVPDGEDPMERGSRLEPEAITRFQKETKKKVDTSLVIWTRSDNKSIAVSPDGIVGKTEAVEAKCLSSARHIQAYLTGKIPDEYHMQTLQYFIVNDSLKILHFVFYDPRVLVKDFFIVPVHRADLEGEIKEFLAYQKKILPEIDGIVNRLTKF